MADTKPTPKKEVNGTNNLGISIAIVIAVVLAALAGGYYYFQLQKTNQVVAPSPVADQTGTKFTPPVPVQQTGETAAPQPIVTPEQPITTPGTDPYENWKTYTYHADSTHGFSIKYPAGYAVGEKYDKDGKTFVVYPTIDTSMQVMEIYYETDGSVRFSPELPGASSWSYFDQVVKSFTSIKP